MARIENVNLDGTDYDVGKIASTSDLGVVQIGSGLSITPAGVLSATGGGGPTYTAGNGIDITSNVISIDTAVVPEISDLATVATTGSYNDLTNKPTIPAAQVNSDWNANSGVAQILNKPTLATVATSGSYNDLSNKPTIPAAQVNSDWDAVSGVAQILNKPTLATVATSGSYNDLSNKPTIPTVPSAGTTATAVSTTSSGGSATTWSRSDHVHSISGSTITSALGYTPYNSTNPDGYTSNTGTITGVSANGTSVATSGVANIPAATTGRYGVTQLSSSTSSTSTSLAATPSAVKAAYDLANGKQDPLTAGANISISGGVISATDTTYLNFVGTDGTSTGASGLVPAPTTTDAGKFLKADGTWETVQSGSSYTAGDNIDITNNVIDTAITVPLIGSTVSTPSSVAYVNTANIADGAVTIAKMDFASILDLLYPVGSYYETSDTNFNPNTAWGGTWVEDSAGLVTVAKDTETFTTVGGTGGEKTHTLTVAEMPNHRHPMTRPRWWGNDPSIGQSGSIYGQTSTTTAYGEEPGAASITHYAIGYEGGSGAHNNLQPYIVVKRWHRTA